MLEIRGARRVLASALCLVLVAGAAACGDDEDDSATSGDEAGESGGGGDGGGGSDEALQIALLLPETKTARYETQDRPLFEAKVEELCPNCEILYSNADQDAAEQQGQAEAALTNGADVLVLDPVDSASAASIVTQAKSQDVPVISYDRLITDADIDFYISYDNVRVGELQATALVDKLEADGVTDGSVVMIHGSPTDNNATLFKEGAKSVLDETDFDTSVEFDTPDWSPDEAQREMEQATTQLGVDGFVGVYAANDGTAGGAIAAMKAAGVDPLPPVTGQDAELAAVQRILAGEQYMTVYKAIKPEAEIAAEVAIALAQGDEPPEEWVNDEVDNGMGDIPSQILEPVAVTTENINDTIVADGFWSPEEICEGSYAAACQAAGIG